MRQKKRKKKKKEKRKKKKKFAFFALSGESYKRVWRKMRRRSRAVMGGRWRITAEKELAIAMEGVR